MLGALIPDNTKMKGGRTDASRKDCSEGLGA